MGPDSRKSTEEKIEILKTIIEERPFGFTAMELYKNYKDRHEIGSRNTLKNYLGVLLEKGEIQKSVVGNYKVYRSKKISSMGEIFELHPHFQFLMLKTFAAITKVLENELENKGEMIGKEMGLTAPIRDSKLYGSFMKKKPIQLPKERRILVFHQFLQKIKENQEFPFNDETELILNEDQAILTIRNTKALEMGAWVIYYIQVGLFKTVINEIMSHKVSIKIEKINHSECRINIKLE